MSLEAPLFALEFYRNHAKIILPSNNLRVEITFFSILFMSPPITKKKSLQNIVPHNWRKYLSSNSRPILKILLKIKKLCSFNYIWSYLDIIFNDVSSNGTTSGLNSDKCWNNNHVFTKDLTTRKTWVTRARGTEKVWWFFF